MLLREDRQSQDLVTPLAWSCVTRLTGKTGSTRTGSSRWQGLNSGLPSSWNGLEDPSYTLSVAVKSNPNREISAEPPERLTSCLPNPSRGK
jgi:hypothetical protein